MPFMDLNDSDAHEKEVTLKDIVLFKSLIPYIKPQWRLLVISGILLPLISLTQVVQPFIIKSAIDGPIANNDLAGLAQKAVLFLVLILVHYVLRYAQMFVAQITGQRIILSIRTSLYNHLQRMPVSFYHQHPIGKLVTRTSSDVENISEVFASGGIAIFSDFAVIIGIIVAMFIMDAGLASIAVMIIPAVILTMEFFRRRSRGAYNQLRVQLAQVNSMLNETLSGIDVIQLLRREQQNTRQFEGKSREYMHTNMRSVVYDSAFTASVEFLSITTVLLVLSYIVFQQAALGAAGITFGVLVAFLQYIQMLFEPIEDISDKFTIIQSGLASVEKIMELMQVQAPLAQPVQPKPLARAKGHIRFDDVVFGYRADEPILQGISFEIEPGEKVAIIGPTGAGKSTIIRLLNRQYDPQAGRILIDGVDIRDYEMDALRHNIVVIPQEEFLFSRSIQDNITLEYNGQVDIEQLQAVASAVHANIVIDRQPQGYQTILPERGRNLSNGERQLLVFARALWHNPAIIVLDEATSSIDPGTEALIQDALEKTLVGRTGIVIAHRLSTIEQVDKVLVIDHGRIVETGTPKALYHEGGLYREYVNRYFAKHYNSAVPETL